MANNIFTPSHELLELQKVELDLFKKFAEVCKKYNIKYYAEGGTLLGAVRHKGFIPWDDDIDVQMTMEEYLKFRRIVRNEFKMPYVFQDYLTDEYFDISPMARIRNANTTGCTKWEFDNVNDILYNRGVFIDIWVLFSVPDGEEERLEQKKNIDNLWRIIRGWYAQQNISKGKPSAYAQYLPCWENVMNKSSIIELKQKYIDICNFYDDNTCEVGMTSFRTMNPKYIWKREWFNEMIDLPFEDTIISCPKMYDEILTKTYGDWRIPVLDGTIHEMRVLDINTPYLEHNEFH